MTWLLIVAADALVVLVVGIVRWVRARVDAAHDADIEFRRQFGDPDRPDHRDDRPGGAA